MKRMYRYLLWMMGLTGLFSFCYYVSYQSVLRNFSKNAEEQGRLLAMENTTNEGSKSLANLQADIENGELNSELNQTDLASVSRGQEDKVSSETKYILQEYDIANGAKKETQLPTPVSIVGLTRSEVMTYLQAYMTDLPLEDYQKGLLSYDLIAFSPENITVQKRYDSSKVVDPYYLLVVDNMLVVFYSDKKTIYEYTDIHIEELPEMEQKKLYQGIPIKSQEELYSVLETYTS